MCSGHEDFRVIIDEAHGYADAYVEEQFERSREERTLCGE